MRRGLSLGLCPLLAAAALVLTPATASAHPLFKSAVTSLAGVATPLPGGGVRLTRVEDYNAAGAAYTATRVRVDRGFTARFTFTLSPGSCGGDGMAFVVQDASRHALGSPGGYLGFGQGPAYPGISGIRHSLAVEIDTFQNTAEVFGPGGKDDPPVPHISVQTHGAAPNDADPQYSLATALTPKVGNGEAHTMRVQYLRRGLLDVRLDGHHVIRLKINLAKRLALRHGRAYLGFTAGTGACTEDATVTHIRFTPGG